MLWSGNITGTTDNSVGCPMSSLASTIVHTFAPVSKLVDLPKMQALHVEAGSFAPRTHPIGQSSQVSPDREDLPTTQPLQIDSPVYFVSSPSGQI
jgi:hypothetical protein